MAQAGDTITYTYDNDTDDDTRLIPESEDISSVDTATVDYCYSAGGISNISDGGSGGAVENVEIDVSSHDTLYIFVSSGSRGRYRGRSSFGSGGSTEVTFSDTNATDSSDEPFLVGAGGGGSGYEEIFNPFAGTISGSEGGGRGGSGVGGGGDGEGTPPPLGGDGAPDDSTSAGDGDGAVDDESRGYITDGGTTIKGGGSPPNGDGEVQITYSSGPEPPTAPSNLTATLQ